MSFAPSNQAAGETSELTVQFTTTSELPGQHVNVHSVLRMDLPADFTVLGVGPDGADQEAGPTRRPARPESSNGRRDLGTCLLTVLTARRW